MLEIEVTLERERWDEEKEEFIPPVTKKLRMEHSLVSLHKWESKWHKPFLTNQAKTLEETIDYFKFMTLTQNVDPDIYKYIDMNNVKRINEYIENPMTATTFSNIENSNKINQEQITAELIYYWMIALNVPVEFQKWHLNSLLTLIRVCNIKNQPAKKMERRDVMSRYKDLNAARRKQLNSKG